MPQPLPIHAATQIRKGATTRHAKMCFVSNAILLAVPCLLSVLDPLGQWARENVCWLRTRVARTNAFNNDIMRFDFGYLKPRTGRDGLELPSYTVQHSTPSTYHSTLPLSIDSRETATYKHTRANDWSSERKKATKNLSSTCVCVHKLTCHRHSEYIPFAVYVSRSGWILLSLTQLLSML